MNPKINQAVQTALNSLAIKLQNDLQSLFDTYTLAANRIAQSIINDIDKLAAEEAKEIVREASEKA